MSVSTITILKNGVYIPAFIIGAGISPEMFNALAMLIILDTLTGIIKAGVIGGWISVKSKKMANGIIAKLILILVPITLAALSVGTNVDVGVLIGSVMGVLLLSETYSIIGNIHSIKTKRDVPEFDAIDFILKSINRILNSVTKNG